MRRQPFDCEATDHDDSEFPVTAGNGVRPNREELKMRFTGV